MLHIKTKVKVSSIEGLGLFADESITAGTLVSKWESGFDCSFDTEAVSKLSTHALSFLQRYGWDGPDGGLRVSLDDSRYVNHSSTPNLIVDPNGCGTHAARDISAGDELTEDYSSYDHDFASYGSSWS